MCIAKPNVNHFPPRPLLQALPLHVRLETKTYTRIHTHKHGKAAKNFACIGMWPCHSVYTLADMQDAGIHVLRTVCHHHNKRKPRTTIKRSQKQSLGVTFSCMGEHAPRRCQVPPKSLVLEAWALLLLQIILRPLNNEHHHQGAHNNCKLLIIVCCTNRNTQTLYNTDP